MGPQAVAAERAMRFPFGRNWRRFLDLVDEDRVATAQASLGHLLENVELDGKSFLDVGSGSGLFSLAARRLGARVRAFDTDPESVACAQALAERFAPGDEQWSIERGSVLDPDYTRSLGRFDVVYAWGVLHHTGEMYLALERTAALVAEGGRLCVSIYNDQGLLSTYWRAVKFLYNRRPLLQPLLIALHAPYLLGLRLLLRALSGRLREERGMAYWYDLLDWLGGYPFEVARPDQIVTFLERRGLRLAALHRVHGNRSGCNEFVFRRPG